MGGWGSLKWLSYYLFTTTSAKHGSQDHGSRVVNRVSSQVNDIRPFEIKVQYSTRGARTTAFGCFVCVCIYIYEYMDIVGGWKWLAAGPEEEQRHIWMLVKADIKSERGGWRGEA